MLRRLSADLQLWVNLERGTWPTIQEIMVENQTDEENILLGHESEWAEEDHVEEDEETESEDEDYEDYGDDMYGGYGSPSPYDSDELRAFIWAL